MGRGRRRWRRHLDGRRNTGPAGDHPGIGLPDQVAFLARVGDLAGRVPAILHSLRRGCGTDQPGEKRDQKFHENSKLLI